MGCSCVFKLSQFSFPSGGVFGELDVIYVGFWLCSFVSVSYSECSCTLYKWFSAGVLDALSFLVSAFLAEGQVWATWGIQGYTFITSLSLVVGCYFLCRFCVWAGYSWGVGFLSFILGSEHFTGNFKSCDKFVNWYIHYVGFSSVYCRGVFS